MSATSDSDRSPYRRDNWWGYDRDGTDADTDAGHDASGVTTEDQGAFVAHKILRDQAPLLCGRSLDERGEKIELSDPVAYPPADPVADQRHAARVNAETGDMNWGYSTWVQLDDLPARTFYDVVEDCLALWRYRHDLVDRECDRLRAYARSEKSKQDTSDDEIIGELIVAILSPGAVEDGLEFLAR